MFCNHTSNYISTRLLRVICGFLLAIALCFPVSGQTPSDLRLIFRNTNSDKLIELGEKLQQLNTINKEKAIKVAQENGWIIHEILENGTIIELQKLDAFGKPVYYTTHNIDAAATISTNKVWVGGGLGLSLSGIGLTVGEWEGKSGRWSNRIKRPFHTCCGYFNWRRGKCFNYRHGL